MKFISFFLLNTLCAISVYANTATENFLGRLDRIRTLSMHFTQTIYANARIVERNAGEMALKRPNKLFWISTVTPKQIIVADGKQVYIYDPELEQVMIKPQKTLFDNAPASLLLGMDPNRLKEEFAIKQKADHFTLTSKKPSDYDRIECIFKRNSAVPELMRFVDPLRQVISLEFSQVKLNHPIKERQFQFSIPRGVDVIRS